MAQNRTKTYSGEYTSRDNKKHKVTVRVFKRLLPFALAIALVRGAYSFTVNIKSNIDENKNIDADDEVLDETKALIEKIIAENPNLLKEIEQSTYVIKAGDTLSGIAEECGNTLNRICSLNKIEKTKIIYPGEEIKIETIKEKTGDDREIACLESYLHDYVLNSPLAVIARNPSSELDNASRLYRSMIYGEPKNEADVDPDSIFGMFVSSYLKFHENPEQTPEAKRQYVNVLMNLADEVVEKLNFGGAANNIVPYSTYSIYMQNGTTKYEEIKDEYHSIYN